MSPVAERPPPQRCERCDAVVERCAFCDEEGCRDPLCYRCVRIALGQEMPQPHGHGG